MIVAPTEPPSLRAIADKVSVLPEQYGVDVMWIANGQKWGVQRKELKDFIASVKDGRLSKEVAQMKSLDVAVLLIEGQGNWTSDGVLMGRDYGGTWTKAQHWGIIWDTEQRGIWYMDTRGLVDTIESIQRLESWSRKDKHDGLIRRLGAARDIWGTVDNEDYLRHLVMGLPGVGAELAGRIVERFGCPFVWGVSKEDLALVQGLGKKKIEVLWAALAKVKVDAVVEVVGLTKGIVDGEDIKRTDAVTKGDVRSGVGGL